MAGFRRYKVSTKAVEDGIRLGIKDDVAKKIAEMARNAAIITYPGANRRFENFAMNIQNGTVIAVLPFSEQVNEKALVEKVARKRRGRKGSSGSGAER